MYSYVHNRYIYSSQITLYPSYIFKDNRTRDMVLYILIIKGKGDVVLSNLSDARPSITSHKWVYP